MGLYQITPIALKEFENGYSHMDGSFKDIKNSCWDKYNETENGFQLKDVPCRTYHLLEPSFNRAVADWYFNWIHERTGTVDDTLIAWNMGIGKWRKWKRRGSKFSKLPKTTQAYLKKYEKLTGEELS